MGDGDTWTNYKPTTDTGGDKTDIREWLRSIGIPLPTSLTDLENIGADLRKEMDKLDELEARLASGEEVPGFWGKGVIGKVLTSAQVMGQRQKVNSLAEKLFTYAGQYFGTQGEQIISRTLRPPAPDVAKLPTPEEFLGGYEEAYATHIEGLRASGGLSAEEVQFANEILRNETYQKYLAKLGEFAKSGLSPFTLKEVSREERGIAPGTPAGAALDKALGPGVTEPTTITGTGNEVAEAMDTAGQGVPKEFISLARLSPSDFLAQTLSPTDIKLAFAGSASGAGRTARRVPAGFTASPRRV